MVKPISPKPRRSAAVLVTREVAGQLEILLVRRNPKLRFFGGFYAFPGGVIDSTDGADDVNFAEVAERCARRELFEETGIWIGDSPPQDRDEYRRQLIDSEGTDLSYLTREPPSLAPLFEITTPEFAPRRYQTVYFHAECPRQESLEVWPGELVGGEFIAPEFAVERWRRGEWLIAPPVLFAIEQLLEVGLDLLAAATRAEAERLKRGKLHPVRFTPGIFVAPLKTQTLPPAGTTNTFIVGTDPLYIIDPAPDDPSEQARLFAKLDHCLDSGQRFRSILLTHHHPDHVGALAQTASRYDLEVWAHPETLSRLSYEGRTQPLGDGDLISLGESPDGRPGWQLEALHTPGHAPGHLAFLENRYSTVIAGDLISAVSTIVIDPDEGDMETYLNSLKRLLARSPAMVHPSHGPGLRDGQRALASLIRHRQEREEKTCAQLTPEPESIESLVTRVYDDVDPRAHALARRSLEAGLIKLEREGRAERTPNGWKRGAQ